MDKSNIVETRQLWSWSQRTGKSLKADETLLFKEFIYGRLQRKFVYLTCLWLGAEALNVCNNEYSFTEYYKLKLN